MKRTAMLFLVIAPFCFVAGARAADPLKEGLSAVPAEAVAFIAVPSLAQLDADYQRAIANLGLQAFVPPPMNSLIAALKMNAPMLAGIDESGPLLVVFMPAASIVEIQLKQAMIVPAKDPKAMIDAMGGKPGPDNLYSVQLFGQPFQATITNNRVILAKVPEVAKAVKAATAGIDTKLNATDLKVMAGLDVIVWADAERLIASARQLIDSLVMPMLGMQAAQGGFQAKSAEMNKQQLQMFLDGARTMTIGLGLEAAGLDLRFALSAKEGTEFAKRVQIKTTTDPLLTGLPASEYLLTFGQILAPEAVRASLESFGVISALGEGNENIDKEKLTKLQNLLSDMVSSVTAVRATVEGLPAAPEGLFGVSVIIETTDSKKWTGMVKDLVELGKQLVSEAAKGDPSADQEEVASVLAALTYTEDAEKIGGADVSHLKFDLDKVAKEQEVDEEDLEQIKKIIGKEGVLFRVAAVDGKSVALSFGGGEPNAAKLIESAKSAGAPLAEEAGIKKVSPNLPKERGSVMYIAVDRIVRTIRSVQKAMDEEVLPLNMPPVHAPLAIAETGGNGWMQIDLFVPTDLMVAGKNAAMAMMGGQPPPDQAAPTDEDEKE
jgi:hypothetical protein